jgi:hypothetical protein
MSELETIPIPRIEAALAAVMSDVQGVAKNDRNTAQGFSFRGIDAVVNAVGPALRRHGVIVLPKILSREYGSFATKSGTLMHTASIEVEYTFVGPASDSLSCSVLGEAADAGDKATPKAMSVAFRTALLQALCLPTDEPDPDSQSYERAAEPVPMSASQQSALAAHFEAIADDDEAKTSLRKWWRMQRLPHKDSLNGEQADLVLNHMSGGSTP